MISRADHFIDELIHTEAFQSNPKSARNLSEAVYDAFLRTDYLLKQSPELSKVAYDSGSTGLVAILTVDGIIIANAGDSRAILYQKKPNGKVIQLSSDHKPSKKEEKKRILAAGGSIFRGRVCGGVAVSRGFGDFWFKQNHHLPYHEQLVIVHPSISIRRRQYTTDHYLLLACDGIYDVMSNEVINELIQVKLAEGCTDPSLIAEYLLDEGLQRGSRDNMTIILVFFTEKPRRKLLVDPFYQEKKCIVM